MNEHQKELIDLKLSLCRRLVDVVSMQEVAVEKQKQLKEDMQYALVNSMMGYLAALDSEITYLKTVVEVDK